MSTLAALTFDLCSGVFMLRIRELTNNDFQWWDRERDDAGREIRMDVRKAGHEVERNVRKYVAVSRGDDSEAAELLEGAVEQISHYLDRKRKNPFSTNACALIVVSTHRALRRRVAKLRREQTVGGSNDLASRAQAADWRDAIDRMLDFEKLTRRFNKLARDILALRIEGHGWKHVAERLGIAVTVAKRVLELNLARARAKVSRSHSHGSRQLGNQAPR